ncbi:hypothetical protein SNE40_016122 [Patella caerulea]|uniref:C-type lectin domain-containing protein n=1 Tax=Patella caerulea TaxID=87958 RepID=A0AAN8PCP1_PATCE
MMGMLHIIITELYFVCLAGFLISGLTGCQDEMYYLKTKLNQSNANTRCIEMGYQGLAELKTQQQQKHANDLVYFNNKGNTVANVWIGVTYNMSTERWWWGNGDEWMNNNNTDVWREGEPNRLDDEQCVRLWHSLPGPVMGWANRQCSFEFYALCQRTKDLSSNYMELLYSDRTAPVGSTTFRVRSLMDCVTSCVFDCSCQAVHYSGDECRQLTYYLLDSNLTTTTDNMGVIYAKTLNEQPEASF